MEERKVYVVLRDNEEHWDTGLLLSQEDALRVFNLASSIRNPGRLELSSVGGYAELKNGDLQLTYRNKSGEGRLTVSVGTARSVLERAIETAAEQERDDEAHECVWEWVNERFDARVLTLKDKERVEGKVLFAKGSYFAVQKIDASVWVVDVSVVRGHPQVGRSVIVEHGPDGGTAIFGL